MARRIGGLSNGEDQPCTIQFNVMAVAVESLSPW